jgi:hypothetical protein
LNTDRPGGGRQIRELAEDIAATVSDGTVRAHASTKRAADASFPANTYGTVAPQVQIAAAPAGLYQVSWFARWKKDTGVGSPVGLLVTVDGTPVIEDTVAEVTDSYQRTTSGLVTVAKAAAGTLTVGVQLRGPLCGVSVLLNSRIDVTRVSI